MSFWSNSYGVANAPYQVFPEPIMADRSPGIYDTNYPILQLWFNYVLLKLFYLAQKNSQTGAVEADWVEIAAGSGAIEGLTGNSGGEVFPDTNNNINVIGDGTTVNVVGDPATNTLTISAINAGFTWNNITGTSATMAAENGYFANNSGLVTLTLPSTASSTFGNTIEVVGWGAGGWQIAQNANQQIILGNASTTVGVTGYLASTNQYDQIELIYSPTTNLWTANARQGNITVN